MGLKLRRLSSPKAGPAGADGCAGCPCRCRSARPADFFLSQGLGAGTGSESPGLRQHQPANQAKQQQRAAGRVRYSPSISPPTLLTSDPRKACVPPGSMPNHLPPAASQDLPGADKAAGLGGTLRHSSPAAKPFDVQAVSVSTSRVEPGEIVAFSAPTAPQTTTLKMAHRLISPSRRRGGGAGCVPFRPPGRFLPDQITLLVIGPRRQQLICDLPPLDSLRVNALAVYGHRRQRSQTAASTSWRHCSILGEELTRPVAASSRFGQRD